MKQLEAFVFRDHGITYPNAVDTMRATSVGAGVIWRPIDRASLEDGVWRPIERISAVQRDVELYFRLTLRKGI